MTRRNASVLTRPFLVAILFVQVAAGIESAKLRITPSTVELGTFYGGAKVHLAGEATAGSSVIVVVRGPSVAEAFNKVGRVGPIWVNTGKVTISGVPSLLLIFSSETIQACLNSADIDRYQLDPDFLKRHMRIETHAPDLDRIAKDFLAFKAQRGVYRVDTRSVRLGTPEEGELPYNLDFEMPRAATPGKYRVTVLECRKGAVATQSDVDLALVEVGFPALIAHMAKEHASVYGIGSIVIAMLAGFGIDYLASRIFKRKAAAG